MATLCIHCGSPLKDGARFCNVCGTLVPPHLLSPNMTTSSASPAPQFFSSAETTLEQRNQSLPHRPARFPTQPEPPIWMRELDKGSRPQEKASVLPPQAGSFVNGIPQLDFPLPEPQGRLNSSSLGMRANVGQQREPAVRLPLHGASVAEEIDELDDLPTRPLAASTPEKVAQRHSPSSVAYQQKTDVDEFEQLNTVTHSTQKGIKPIALPLGEPFQRRDEGIQQQMPSLERSIYRSMSISSTRASAGLGQEARQTPPPQLSVPVRKQRRSRRPLLLSLVVLLLLALAGGIGAWILIYQPFSVPVITQPEQTFSSHQLGISLLYPSAWKSQVNQGVASAQLYDSSHTAQISIANSSSSSADLSQYLRQKASQLGITGQRMGPSLSFANASWQQLQGSVLLRGASYTETLLATIHNQHLFTILFLAPQTIYAQEDQLVFSGIRSSFQFSS